MNHRHGIALQPESDTQARAIAGDGVVGFRDGLQPQILKKYLVTEPNEVETLVRKLMRIEHGAAAEAFPQNPDMAAGNRHHHMRESTTPMSVRSMR